MHEMKQDAIFDTSANMMLSFVCFDKFFGVEIGAEQDTVCFSCVVIIR